MADSNSTGLLIALIVGVFGGTQLQKLIWQMRRGGRQRWNRGNRRGSKVMPFRPRHDAVAKVPDAADQLRTVMKADFKAQALLNKSEARLFKALDKMVIEMRPGWQVMAQVMRHSPPTSRTSSYLEVPALFIWSI